MPLLVATSGQRVPDSLIRKFGFEPIPLAPTPQAPETQGVCAVAKGLAQALCNTAPPYTAAVMTTRCDQLRRSLECVASSITTPFILLNLPATQNTPASEKQDRDEHARLEQFLSALSGHTSPNSNPLPSFTTTSFSRTNPNARFKLGLLACTTTSSDKVILHMLDSLGMVISLDLSGQAMPEGCPTIERRPNVNFFTWLTAESARAQLDGWVLLVQPWCDLYRAEIDRLKAEVPLPWLILETGPEPALASLRMRAEAFLEMIVTHHT